MTRSDADTRFDRLLKAMVPPSDRKKPSADQASGKLDARRAWIGADDAPGHDLLMPRMLRQRGSQVPAGLAAVQPGDQIADRSPDDGTHMECVAVDHGCETHVVEIAIR